MIDINCYGFLQTPSNLMAATGSLLASPGVAHAGLLACLSPTLRLLLLHADAAAAAVEAKHDNII